MGRKTKGNVGRTRAGKTSVFGVFGSKETGLCCIRIEDLREGGRKEPRWMGCIPDREARKVT